MPSWLIFAVWAPNTMRFFSVLWRSVSGENRVGNCVVMVSSVDGGAAFLAAAGDECGEFLADAGIDGWFLVSPERLLPDQGRALAGRLAAAFHPRTVILRRRNQRTVEGRLEGRDSAIGAKK